MIDDDKIEPLVQLALGLPESSRAAMLAGLTHLQLTPQAWRCTLPLVQTLQLSSDEQTVDVLARVPLLTLRRRLRSRAAQRGDALGLRIALQLAQQHDGAGVQRLMAEFAADPGAEVACALACVLQDGQGVVAEDLQPGLESPDEMVRLWTAIAMARVSRRDGSGPEFEPLEQLWDACVRPEPAERPVRLFDHPPRMFWGDPAWAAAQLAVVQPLPDAALQFLESLKQNDFDSWTPRDPDRVEGRLVVKALMAGLTGHYDSYGDPVVAAGPTSPSLPPPPPSPEPGPPLQFKIELDRLMASAAATPELPGWAIGNQVLDLAQAVSPDSPFAIGPVLEDEHLLQGLPREPLAWAMGRNGPVRVIDELTARMKSQPMSRRIDSIEWLRDIAAEIGLPPPYQGAGGDSGPAAAPHDLIDDLDLIAMVGGSDGSGSADPLTGPDRGVDEGLLSAGKKPALPLPPSPEFWPAPAAADAAPPDAQFHFVLEGEAARGDAIVTGTRATIEFRFDRPGPEVLALVESEALDQAREADRDIMLELTAYGSLTLPGTRQGVAKFVQRSLVAPVAFTVQAGAPDDKHSGVHVEFIVRGETVHQADLPIAVLADAEALLLRSQTRLLGPAIGATLLDDAAGAAMPPPQRVRLALAVDAEGFRIDLTHWVGDEPRTYGPFVAPEVDRSRLEALVTSIRKDLEGFYRHPMWSHFAGEVDDSEVGKQAREQLPRNCSAVAAVGSRLNWTLRDEAPAIAQALDHVDQELPEGSTLTIATDAVYLPWEIFYPRPWLADFTDAQREQYPLDPGLFWGARFAIETVQLRNSGSLVDLRKKHLASPPRISINLNPRILVDDLSEEQQPLAVQKAWAGTLAGSGSAVTVHDECKAMREVLQNAATDAGLVYVYCHGSSARPFGGGDELLDLAKGCTLTPLHLAGDKAFAGAPIVFLNACESAAHSPLAFSSFLKEFRRRGALGMIAASFPVPIVFGAHFGAEVVRCVLARQGSLAVALQRLRRRHLLERGNPIPLFYALQCQITYP